jgi:hypothetical protein
MPPRPPYDHSRKQQAGQCDHIAADSRDRDEGRGGEMSCLSGAAVGVHRAGDNAQRITGLTTKHNDMQQRSRLLRGEEEVRQVAYGDKLPATLIWSRMDGAICHGMLSNDCSDEVDSVFAGPTYRGSIHIRPTAQKKCNYFRVSTLRRLSKQGARCPHKHAEELQLAQF